MYQSNEGTLCIVFENLPKSRIQHYILSGQKFIKNAKNGQFGEFLKPEACSQKVLPDKSIRTKIV